MESNQLGDAQPEQPKHLTKKKRLLVLAAILAVIVSVGLYLYVQSRTDGSEDVANRETSSNTAKPETKTDPKDEVSQGPTCEGESSFADVAFGAAFCYPADWGIASVTDAKVGSDDTGHRQMIRFSENPMFAVGGVSDDWTTTVGRDTGCLEPTNRVPELSSYNTAWHDIVGSGEDISFATRSLPSSVGGYDMTEDVGNLLRSGVCATGHKVIDGSRYRVISAGFYRDFAEASGIKTPRLHMDNPDVLFSTLQRQQYDELLASIVRY